MAEEKQNVLNVLADLEERSFADRAVRRRARVDKLSEGKSRRFRRRMERIESARQEYDMAKVRVLPANDEMRKFLRHPGTNMGFHETGSVEWPLDSFTERRLRDGDITLESIADSEARQQRRAAPARATRPTPAGPTGSVGPHGGHD